MERQGPPGQPHETKSRACLGALYFSEARYAKQKSPVCSGFVKRLKPTDDAAQLPTDSVPGGDFKYLCLGYSAYDEQGLKRAAAARTSPADAVQLPYCEGLEIVSSAAVSHRPELMGAGGPDLGAGGSSGAAAPPPSTPPPPGGDARQRPGRSWVPGAGRLPGASEDGSLDWSKFTERFGRISRRMVEKMGQNASYMAATTRRSWQQLVRELGGGGDKER